jgi:hypothetical protein
MLARIRDWHRNLSWNVGYRHGKNGLLAASPWWVDAEIYSLAYMHGMGVELAPPANTATEEAARAKEFFDTIERPGTKR